jgi:hypothetical protein
MHFVTDPMSLALALGLLGPAAVDEQGLFDEGPREMSRKQAAEALAQALDAVVDEESQSVILTETHTVDLDPEGFTDVDPV